MRFHLSLMFVVILLLLPSPLLANDTVEKTDCKLAIGYDSMDELKADLLLSAKRLAVNELFGELIAAATAVDDFVVTSDQIRASSLGLVREDAIRYYNGDNLGEVCITISVYTTDEDRKQFVPIRLNKRNCISNPDMTNRELRAFAEEEAIIKALVEYNRKLEGQQRDRLLNLLQRVTYLENGFLPDTDSYCVRVEGYITPIEAVSLFEAEVLDLSSPPVQSPQTGTIITDTPTVTPEIGLSLLVTIDPAPHHIGDSNVSSWEIPNPEGIIYTVRFWFNANGTTESILSLDTIDTDFANPLWINEHFVGIVPQSKPEEWGSEEWQNDALVFIPRNVLKIGENTLRIEANNQGTYDDFMVRNIRLFEGENRYRSTLNTSVVLSDAGSYHIGDNFAGDWPVKDPEGAQLSKFFKLESLPSSDGVFQLSTYHVSYTNNVFINDCYVGVLPGMNNTTWTPALSMRIPQRCFAIGINSLRIEATKDSSSNYDDFLVKDMSILVNTE